MKQYEYKTVGMSAKSGLFTSKTPEVEKLLNSEGAQGWRLRQIIFPDASIIGQSENMLVILEREKN